MEQQQAMFDWEPVPVFDVFRTLNTETQDRLIMQQNILEPWERKQISANLPLFLRFCHESHRVARTRDHYSARTIVEFLRHHSVMEDNALDFKISNNITPMMAHLSMEMFPAINGLFSTKRR